MLRTNIPSPARSQNGAPRTPRRYKPRISRSLCSPTRASPSRLSTVVQQFKENNMDSFVVSPLKRRHSVLSNNTDIQQPQRKSWWKRLDENSGDVIEMLNKNKIENVNNIEELIGYEILSQEKSNHTWNLSESSDCESIHSIVLPQRKLFAPKESQFPDKVDKFIGTRESLAKVQKTHIEPENKTINAGPRNLFDQASKLKNQPVFPSALLSLSANETKQSAITKVQSQPRNLFNNRPDNKQYNMFVDFISSGTDDDFSEVEARPFGFQKKIEQKRRGSSIYHGLCSTSPTSSFVTDVEMNDWELLPSSTMVDNQFEDVDKSIPLKKSRLSKLTDIKESSVNSNNDRSTDQIKQSNKSVSTKNKSKTTSQSKDNVQSQNDNNTSLFNRSRSSKNKSKTSFNSLMKLNKVNQEHNSSHNKNVSINTSQKLNVTKSIHLEVYEEKNQHRNSFQEKVQTMHENVDHDFYKTDNEHINKSRHQTINEQGVSTQKISDKNKINQIQIETCKNNISTNDQQKDEEINHQNIANNTLSEYYIEDNNAQKKMLAHNNDNETRGEIETSNDKQETETSVDNKDLETTDNQKEFNDTIKYKSEEMEAIHDQSEVEDTNDKEGLEYRDNQEEEMSASSDNQDLDATNEQEEELETSEDEKEVDVNQENDMNASSSNQDTNITNDQEELDTNVENPQEEEEETNATDDHKNDEINASLDDQDIDASGEIKKFNARTTELPQYTSENLEESDSEDATYSLREHEDTVETSTYGNEISLKTRQSTLEMYLQKIKRDNMEKRRKIEEELKKSLRSPANDVQSNFKVPFIMPLRRNSKIVQSKSKNKQIKSSVIPLRTLPEELIEDLKYKPPKRFRPTNASWITKRLYKFLETKLEPKYEYKARVRAEILVKNLYEFAKIIRREQIAPRDAVDKLKREMARLDVVKTHFDFHQFFHDYMPREIRIKVNPDMINKISLPREGIFADILEPTE